MWRRRYIVFRVGPNTKKPCSRKFGKPLVSWGFHYVVLIAATIASGHPGGIITAPGERCIHVLDLLPGEVLDDRQQQRPHGGALAGHHLQPAGPLGWLDLQQP